MVVAIGLLTSGCWSPEPPREGGSVRFAVFGDGPYYFHENGRAERVIEALNARSLSFVIHVGDIMWQRCTDNAYRERRALIERIRHAIVYTPGDNEWADCVDLKRNDDPLERLASLRSVFFAAPNRSLGTEPLQLESQAQSRDYAEFVENARWSLGGVLFVTVHVVGSGNAQRPFPGRSQRHDDEVVRRTQAATAWLDESFDIASATNAAAVVVAMHASLVHEPSAPEHAQFAPIHDALMQRALELKKPVLVIHGDEHQYIADRPYRDPATGEPIGNVQRLETFGSPQIGWVDVVVDTTRAEPFSFEPNVTPRWLWW